jgi:hypothetical protein
MPKLHPDVGNAVFYLYREDPRTGKRTGPHGTGFVVGVKSKAYANIRHFYGVTNWHLANDLGASIIRINTQDGKSRFIDLGPEDWLFPRNGDDLAIVDLAGHERDGDQVGHYLVDSMIVDETFIDRIEISIGEDVFMVGLYAEQHGGERNTPAIRFGNLSLLANKTAPIEQPNGILRSSHLVDMRSRTGFSGSPVVLYRIPDNDLSDIPPRPPRHLPMPGSGIHARSKFIALLGVHCGQYWDKVKVSKNAPGRHDRVGDPIAEGDDLYIPGAMNIVVPAWSIRELLNTEVFAMARKRRDEQLSDEAMRRAQPESVEVPVGLQSTDANPTHREDFMRLVGAAARKPEPKD